MHDLKNELEMTETQAREKKAQTSQTLQQLNGDLQTTKQALEECRLREKQVCVECYIEDFPLLCQFTFLHFALI